MGRGLLAYGTAGLQAEETKMLRASDLEPDFQNLKMSKLQNQHPLRVLLVHPGTQHAPRLAATLERRGLLWRFWTGVASPKGRGDFERDYFDILKKRKRRRVVDIPGERLRTIGWVEVVALLLARLPINREKLWHWRNGVFQKLVPQQEIEEADVVVGFDTSAWIIGERAKRAGKMFVLDQSVGHPSSRAKAVREAGGNEEMWPQAFGARLEMVSKAEALEHELADVVVAASSFSKKTLMENGVPEGRIRVIPYGVGGEFVAAGSARSAHFDREYFYILKEDGPATSDSSPVTKPFRFLYAGYLTKRKGIGVLLEAWEATGGCGLRDHGTKGPREGQKGGAHFDRKHSDNLTDRWNKGAELRLVGGGERPENLPAGVVCLGQTPRDALLREMSEADVFVFPSLFEGFALVILEAMAAGLPVITTPNTAGPDLIEDGKEGLIVPAGDAKALHAAMESLLNDPERARSMGRAAHDKAKEYTWERFGERWEAMLNELCS